MKKFVFSVVCFSLIAFKANALAETSLTFGLSFLNVTNISGDGLQSPWGNNGNLGVNVTGYSFWNLGNIGLFASINIPCCGLYNTKTKTQGDIKSGGFQGAFGPAFRYAIDSNFNLLGGFGLNLDYQVFKGDQDDFIANILNLGAGGQVGIKVDFIYLFCLMLGVNFAYNFVNWTDSHLLGGPGCMNKSNIMVNPFIGIGFNSYEGKYGKPD